MGSLVPMDGHALNAKFISAASHGTGWVRYQWRDPISALPYDKIAYIAKIYKYGRSFYLGVGFDDVPAKKLPDCNAAYAEPCAEHSIHRVVGAAASALLTAESSEELDKILLTISNKLEPFADPYAGSVHRSGLPNLFWKYFCRKCQ